MKNSFTLIELTIVMAIIAIITGNLLTIATVRSDADKIRETEIIMDKIENAIAQYLAENGAIPCQADPTLSITHAQFGVALRSTFTNPTRQIQQCDESVVSWNRNLWYDSNIWLHSKLGMVPTKTLQIPDELAFDAWGRRITYNIIETCNTSNNQYVSSNNLTNINYFVYNFLSLCAIPNDGNSNSATRRFAVIDASGTKENTDSGIPYVLVSHGKNGHGAYPRNGGTNRINASAQKTATVSYNLSSDEIANAHMNADGSDIAISQVFTQKSINLKPGPNYFDDIVRYKTKEQIIRKSGRLIDQNTLVDNSNNFYNAYSTNICILANAVLNNTGSTPNYYCNGVCATYINQMANQINNLCS